MVVSNKTAYIALKNYGNTCYVAAIFQCLLASGIMTTYMDNVTVCSNTKVTDPKNKFVYFNLFFKVNIQII